MKRVVLLLLIVSYSSLISAQIYDSITDARDGQVYRIVKIGEQWWMQENLAYLPSVSPSYLESYNREPYYHVYDYQGTSVSEAKANDNYQTYGVLYNWPAALNACLSGWHLPSDDEWKELEIFLGMSQTEANNFNYRGINEGGKLKESGTDHWNSPNTGATNETGFSALPGGYRYYDGVFYLIGITGSWWTSTEYSSTSGYYRQLDFEDSKLNRAANDLYYGEFGMSVRCVKD